jgi:hypothetical protein
MSISCGGETQVMNETFTFFLWPLNNFYLCGRGKESSPTPDHYDGDRNLQKKGFARSNERLFMGMDENSLLTS